MRATADLMNRYAMPLGRMAAALCTTAAILALGAPRAQAAQDTPAAALPVGLMHVAPPFQGGQKVRTPETPDETLVAALASALHRTATIAPLTDSPDQVQLLRVATKAHSVMPGKTRVATGYRYTPMAIMRSDTDIKSWAQLRGRTVCLSAGSVYEGVMARDYGAIEKALPAPADSLLALRTGGCDAAVHDDVTLKALLTYPEWKKFSAHLIGDTSSELVFSIPSGDTATVDAARALTQSWEQEGYLKKLNAKRVRDMAFEVYLDQTVPDCH